MSSINKYYLLLFVFHILLKENRFIIVYHSYRQFKLISSIWVVSQLRAKNIEHLLDQIHWNEARSISGFTNARLLCESALSNGRSLAFIPGISQDSHHYGCHHFWKRKEREKKKARRLEGKVHYLFTKAKNSSSSGEF